ISTVYLDYLRSKEPAVSNIDQLVWSLTRVAVLSSLNDIERASDEVSLAGGFVKTIERHGVSAHAAGVLVPYFPDLRVLTQRVQETLAAEQGIYVSVLKVLCEQDEGVKRRILSNGGQKIRAIAQSWIALGNIV